MSPLNSQQSCINKNSLITALWRLYINCHKLFAVKRQTRGRERYLRDLQVLQLSSLKFPIPEYKINSKQRLPFTIVFRDMVWKVSKLQSGYNELCVYVEPYLTPCTSFVLGLFKIFK